MAITASWTIDKETGLYTVGMGFMDIPHDDFLKFKLLFNRRVSKQVKDTLEIDFCLPTTTLTAQVNSSDQATMVARVFDEVKASMKVPYKSESASKVLQLMDAYEDGEDRYQEFVKQVAAESNISVKTLEAELEPFV
ncbi:hypothetical protein AAFX24_27735 [Vibrio mediterranei]|uniref:hypothetical protein n=1 Tax=Vibrio mediterranei TaxID=689 RepID=UPI0038CE6D26